MAFKELFKKYKIYTIVGIIVLLMLIAGGTTAGVLLTKQDKEQINNSANAAVGEEFTVGNLIYAVLTEGTTNTVEVDDTTSTSISGAIEIPSQVSNGGVTYTVTEIGDSAFSGCYNLTSITIPNSVTSIGEDAFVNCMVLTSITIPDSVTSIGSYAFRYCNRLTSINVDTNNANYSSVNGVLFNKNQTTLIRYPQAKTGTSYTISNSVTSIGGDAFYNCDSLTNITIPDSITSIGESAFGYCDSLTNITIPDSITSIGESAFEHCSGLTEINFNATNMNDLSYGNWVFSYAGQDGTGIAVNIGANVTKIPAYLFYPNANSACSPNIVTLNFAKGGLCESIGEYAFSSCSGLTSITIPNSVTSIGEYAFRYCDSLTNITIPESVISIGSRAFYKCRGLTNVYYSGNINEWVNIDFGDLDANPLYYADNLYLNGQTSTAFSFTGNLDLSNATKIGSYSLYRQTEITSVTIGNSVTSIGNSAFYGCSSLTSATIGNSVTSIGESAFGSCSSLTSITIPNSVTSIGNYAFYNCTSLNNVYFYNDIQNNTSSSYIGTYAFYNNASTVTYWVKDGTS